MLVLSPRRRCHFLTAQADLSKTEKKNKLVDRVHLLTYAVNKHGDFTSEFQQILESVAFDVR